MDEDFAQDPTAGEQDPDTGCTPVPVSAAVGAGITHLMNVDLARWSPSRITRLPRDEAAAFAVYFGDAVGAAQRRRAGVRRRGGRDRRK